MRRLLFALLTVILLAVPLSAQNQSTQQMALVGSPVFTNRLQYLGWIVATEVLSELASAGANGVIPAYTTGCHTLRLAHARFFLANPAQGALIEAVGVVGTNASGAVLLGTATIGSGLTADSSATDGAIQQAIRVQYNNIAGCFTNP